MDYFNTAERESQHAFSKWRDKSLAPLVRLLVGLHIKPNHITILGIMLLGAGCALPPDFFLTAPILLFLYCVVDGIDGPLARHMDQAHEGGAIIDICADQAGVVGVAAAAVFHLGANGSVAVLFAAAYLSFITLALYANGQGIALWRFLRIKYFFYFIYSLSILLLFDLATYLMAGFALYYSFYIFHALHRIHRHHSLRVNSRQTPPTAPDESDKEFGI